MSRQPRNRSAAAAGTAPRKLKDARIVREALMDDSPAKPSRPAPPPAAPREATHETPGPGSEGPPAVPFDDEAT